MAFVLRSNLTDHPYALQTFDGPYPFLETVVNGENELLRIKAPKSYWLYLESRANEQVEVLRRDLNGSNGLPPLGDTFQFRVRKMLSNLKKSFLDTDWRVKGRFKTDIMFISIKRQDFMPGTTMEFPSVITPPPPYGPRPPSSVWREHLPNYMPVEDDVDGRWFGPDRLTSTGRDGGRVEETFADIPMIGCESVFSGDSRIKSEFGGFGDYRQFRINDFSSGIRY